MWGGFGVLLAILLFVAVFMPRARNMPTQTSDVTFPTITLVDPTGVARILPVERASTPEQQAIGLMHRSVVTMGMLFEFPDDAPRAFWMKNTLVPLDISFFTSTGAWVSSSRMEPCTVDPCISYPSGGPAMYALELPAGGLGEHIGRGWTLRINGGTEPRSGL